jgi:hypothetical protein
MDRVFLLMYVPVRVDSLVQIVRIITAIMLYTLMMQVVPLTVLVWRLTRVTVGVGIQVRIAQVGTATVLIDFLRLFARQMVHVLLLIHVIAILDLVEQHVRIGTVIVLL